MTFPVNGTIPGANDDPSISQGQIQTNFNNIVGWSAVDHVQYGAANAGTHNQVTMLTPNVSDPVLSGTQGELYTKAVSSIAQLFFANSTTVTQLTGLAQTLSSSGFVRLPGGLLIQWGTGTATTSGSPAISFATTFATCYSIVCTRNVGSNTLISISAPVPGGSPSNFNAYSSNSSSLISYIAIGI